MIVSGDKDFIQLQFYKGVDQYAPIQKKMIGWIVKRVLELTLENI